MRSASRVLAVPLRSKRLRLWTIRTDHSIWSSCESVRFWAVDTNGGIWSCRETGSDPAAPWTAWTKDWARSAPRFKAEGITAAPLSDKRLQFWAVDRDRRI